MALTKKYSCFAQKITLHFINMRIAPPFQYKDHSMENTAKEWISPQELVEEFGISKSTQAKMRMKKTIPYSKVGNFVRYSRTEIHKWLSEAKVS